MIEIITNFAVERCQVNRIDDEVSTDLIWTEFTWTAAGCCRFSSNSLLLDRLQSTDVLQSYDLLWQQAAKANAAARLPQSKHAPSGSSNPPVQFAAELVPRSKQSRNRFSFDDGRGRPVRSGNVAS